MLVCRLSSLRSFYKSWNHSTLHAPLSVTAHLDRHRPRSGELNLARLFKAGLKKPFVNVAAATIDLILRAGEIHLSLRDALSAVTLFPALKRRAKIKSDATRRHCLSVGSSCRPSIA